MEQFISARRDLLVRSKLWDGVDPALRRSYIPEHGGGGKDDSIFARPISAMLLSTRSSAALFSLMAVVLSLTAFVWSGGIGTDVGLGPADMLDIAFGSWPVRFAGLVAAAIAALLLTFSRHRRLTAHFGGVEQTVPLLEPRGLSKDSTLIAESQRKASGPDAMAPKKREKPRTKRLQDSERHQARRERYERTARFHELAQKRASAWITLLVRGVDLTVDDEVCELKLRRPTCQDLLIGGESFPLVGMGLRLEGSVVKLVFADAGGGDDRVFEVKQDDEQDALELTLALKITRGGADTGAGIAAFICDRPDDTLKRPPAAE